jgi:RimJ/RimL family protein N-acetyltransferase
MPLKPLDAVGADLAASWLAAPENWQWLDFRGAERPPDALTLTVASRREHNVLRIYHEGGGMPVGLVALSDVSPRFRSATLWYVLGDKRYAGRGCTSDAVGELLHVAFAELRLSVVHAWVVQGNEASVRVLERHGFAYAGYQRHAHRIGGEPRDRLLYDLLATEHCRS